ncbi:hypothetical protein GALMADRAFT_151612 [Galerina marginata CBS 339.88]|uniref:Amine oxidase domain-containing protein n=1 Tax=Galerina marginata (strain CBS 339.88) TaxID=685588 RepID=A0A067TU87_GALM3|nr:hypothetical protein GALMADRAFT_151612 [Galerina marginata CBS 339.88]
MKVAVVGSGVSGLGATWLLNEYSDHEVHLYEADARPGGHANTVHFVPRGKTWGEGVDVDTGFIVFNPSTYPNFLRFLQLYPPPKNTRLSLPSWLRRKDPVEDNNNGSGIRILPTEMTFSISRDGGAFEWAGKNLATVFCQARRLVDPQMWRMIYDVLRFNACARRVLLKTEDISEREISIGDYLNNEGYSAAFRNNYLIPMTAAIWSTPPDKCFLDFPARTLIQFLYNHHLLQITGKPSWLTIQGGSHRYVQAILSKLPEERLHLSTPVRSIRNLDREDGQNPQVILTSEAGEETTYDHVILACHSDTALDILRAGGITDEEERILSQFEWNKNEAILHSDINLMPKSRLAWSCWNYLSFTTSVPVDEVQSGYKSYDSDNGNLYPQNEKTAGRSVKTEVDQVSLLLYPANGMNDLQHIPESRYGPVLVTLNPPFEPQEDTIRGRWKYDHPVLDSKAVRAQNEMYKIQNTRSISYAGAYLKYGFHEDGFTSGLLAACSIDDDQNSLPTTTAHTSTLNSMTIPIRKLTVCPPFDIQHADHHIRLSRRGSENTQYEIAARTFDWLEKSTIRPLVGMIGTIVLNILGWLLGINVQ